MAAETLSISGSLLKHLPYKVLFMKYHCFVTVVYVSLRRYTTRHLMSVPSGIRFFCFPSNLNVSFDFVSGNNETLGKTKLFPSGAETLGSV
jgi:hypothetical protein